MTNVINTTPVSLYKGGATVFIELVSLYEQFSIRIKLGLQAQFQATIAELRQFCTIMFT